MHTAAQFATSETLLHKNYFEMCQVADLKNLAIVARTLELWQTFVEKRLSGTSERTILNSCRLHILRLQRALKMLDEDNLLFVCLDEQMRISAIAKATLFLKNENCPIVHIDSICTSPFNIPKQKREKQDPTICVTPRKGAGKALILHIAKKIFEHYPSGHLVVRANFFNASLT